MDTELLNEEVRLWCSGKQTNIRLLLSSLHHVKKGYHRARLCFHPDKLQQSGATPQHMMHELLSFLRMCSSTSLPACNDPATSAKPLTYFFVFQFDSQICQWPTGIGPVSRILYILQKPRTKQDRIELRSTQ